jgi:hypothetical protein
MQEINRTQAIKIVRLASFVLAGPLLTVLSAACQDRSAADRSADVAALTQLEKFWARIDMDEAALSDLLGDDFIGRWGDGTQNTKPEMLAILRSGTGHYAFITLDKARWQMAYGWLSNREGARHPSSVALAPGRDQR